MTKDSLIIRVREALKTISNPVSGRNIVAGGHIASLTASPEGGVRLIIDGKDLDRRAAMAMIEAAKRAAETVAGVTSVSAIATAHGDQAPAAVGHDNPIGLKKRAPNDAAPILPDVRNVVAVASGKGGVGKSTVAANLAVATAQLGLKTGLLDADIYGPSLPTLFNLTERPELRDGKLEPLNAYNVRTMSIGLIVNPEKALAWRGPMVMGAVKQLINDVHWGELDVLFIDTPPGTGDVHLSLAQTKRLTGAVIVSTPQEMALADVRRGIELFGKTNVPVLGVIENMAWLDNPSGERLYLFGQGGAQKAAEDLGAPFLGALPIYPDLRIASDEGTPITAVEPNNPATLQFKEIALAISKRFAD